MPSVTLFDTTDPCDAYVAGFEQPTDIEDGGCKVFWDTAGSHGQVEIVAQDGQIHGTELIRQVIGALSAALAYSEIKDVRRARGDAA